ncbi:MAG: hypothetical protein JXL20_09725 [Deltaproteobacteria bacterium]|nr:hypothetical protein [Deltaproteobacteria bacterium]
MQGFVPGLSSRGVCATCCAPVLVSYLLGEGKSVLQNFSALLQFLLEKLLGYLFFAVFAWGIHTSLPQDIAHRNLIIGATYVILSGLLIFYSFFKPGRACPSAEGQGIGRRLRDSRPSLLKGSSRSMIAGWRGFSSGRFPEGSRDVPDVRFLKIWKTFLKKEVKYESRKHFKRACPLQ